MSEIILTLAGIDPVDFLGRKNQNLSLLKEAFPEVVITARGNNVKLTGDKKYTQKAKGRIEQMVRLLKDKQELDANAMKEIMSGKSPYEARLAIKRANKAILHAHGGKVIKAKTPNQQKLIETSERNDLVFAVGPAGTGKTYTAVALAVRALKNRTVKKIILTRPAVEAGESLGFLPGDLKEKIDPYLRPLYDALDDMIEGDKLTAFMTNRTIEIAPLAFMRGRTLDNAFIILDEAQNCTTPQLKMFLTRIGPNAKAIITGDMSQVDLPRSQKSGLRRAVNILSPLEGIGAVFLDTTDVVRHRLVRDIINAYESSDRYMNRDRKWHDDGRDEEE